MWLGTRGPVGGQQVRGVGGELRRVLGVPRPADGQRHRSWGFVPCRGKAPVSGRSQLKEKKKDFLGTEQSLSRFVARGSKLFAHTISQARVSPRLPWYRRRAPSPARN
jgi:hypothetical protein